jgi:HK97 family phage major capsid protein
MDEETKKELAKFGDELKAGITKDVLEEMKSNQVLRKDLFGNTEKSKDEKVDEQKKSAAEFIKAAYHQNFARAKELSGVSKGMTEGTNADGGFLVPEIFASEIIRVANDYGIVRQNARHWPMNSLKVNVPTANGISVNRVGEGAAAGSSKPTISRTVLTAKKLVALIPVANELLEDADPDVMSVIALLAAEGFAGKEDDWGLNGLASGEGILQNTTVPVRTMATGQDTFIEALLDDYLLLQKLLYAKALSGAKYFMHLQNWINLRSLKDSQGRYLLGNPSDEAAPRLWGLPVVTSDILPTTTGVSTKFAGLANFNYMLFGDRRQYTMEVSREATVTDTDGSTAINAFSQDISVVKFTERIDIQLAEPTKAFAALKTAAS